MKLPPLTHIIVHTVATLPDSFKERKDLLIDLLSVVPQKHPARMSLSEMVNHLESHERHQLEFPQLTLTFQNPKP